MIEYAYVHVPFCKNKCNYCAFTSFINLDYIEKYIDALICQIKKEYDGTPLKSLYLGGGTPSLLNIKQIEKVLSCFNFFKNPEITFEINPENGNKNYLKSLRNLGVNRLSIGVQTFNDDILKILGRIHDSGCSKNAIQNAISSGFENISCDIMYGLFNQTLEDFKKDIMTLIDFEIPHISSYGLKIEEKTAFYKFCPDNLPNEEVQEKMYREMVLDLSNYEHYEISNFAKNKNFISKHNYNYWKLNPYFGFGVSASGFDGKKRYVNSNLIKKYLENPLLKEEVIEADLLSETIFLGFRTKEGINISDINKTFGIDFEKKYSKILEKYINTGHIKKENNNCVLTLDGILISNYILCDFL